MDFSDLVHHFFNLIFDLEKYLLEMRQYSRMKKEFITNSSLVCLYACTELKHAWQRSLLLTAYLLSYLPQILDFIVYVLASTTYKIEFKQTCIMAKDDLRKLNRFKNLNDHFSVRVTERIVKACMTVIVKVRTGINAC